MIYWLIFSFLGVSAVGWAALAFVYWRKIRATYPDRADPGVKIVADLDRMVAGPTAFKWKGRTHYVRPMTTETFLKVLNQLSLLNGVAKLPNGQKEVSEDEVLRIYANIFSIVCDTISYHDVKKMNYAQINALYREVMVLVTGKDFTEQTEKKTLKTA